MSPTLDWRPEALWQTLEPRCPGLTVEVLAEVDSTNTRLLERGRTDPTPCLLVAERQTAGRGRQGRSWLSVPGASLTATLALPLAPAGPHGWGGLSLAVGVALAQALQPEAPPPGSVTPAVQLKWPNDLWLRDPAARGGGRKLGGILIETTGWSALAGAGPAVRWTVIGFGLNLAVEPPAAAVDPGGLASGYAGVQAFWPEADAPAVLHRVAPAVLDAAQVFAREGFAPFLAGYAARDLLHQRPVDVDGAPGLAGIADGVTPQGALRVRHAAGVALLQAGEVRVRLTDETRRESAG